ncbi:hypothetical protein SISSUDRAFT_968731, partial [Sistotremastrum suecicum HHB10207 ss-3]
ATFKLELSDDLKRRGVNSSFHASVLRLHVANDDRLFPGRQFHQLAGFNDSPTEWDVDRIIAHSGAGSGAAFKVLWKSGD